MLALTSALVATLRKIYSKSKSYTDIPPSILDLFDLFNVHKQKHNCSHDFQIMSDETNNIFPKSAAGICELCSKRSNLLDV